MTKTNVKTSLMLIPHPLLLYALEGIIGNHIRNLPMKLYIFIIAYSEQIFYMSYCTK